MDYADTGEQRQSISVALAPATPDTDQDLAIGVAERQNDVKRERVGTIRVLLVDDHVLIREGLCQLFSLEEDIRIVGEAVDGFTALEQIRLVQPDVVLMDIHLPVTDGIAVTRQITQQFPSTHVIMLTMYRQHQQVIEAMRSGAKGYLLKSTSSRDVAQAIRTVYAGGVALAPSLTGVVVQELRRQPVEMVGGASVNQGMAQLSEKEIEIIRYLASGMSNREIADHLAYSEKTVKNYLSIIFQKLHLRDRTQVAIFALRQGLLPEEDL
ncbi:MAG TPA: response regulator transcription factor [Dictyobacter sp.]|nr:response regulator transcription factor [Dictyobacter sp.]